MQILAKSQFKSLKKTRIGLYVLYIYMKMVLSGDRRDLCGIHSDRWNESMRVLFLACLFIFSVEINYRYANKMSKGNCLDRHIPSGHHVRRSNNDNHCRLTYGRRRLQRDLAPCSRHRSTRVLRVRLSIAIALIH